MNANLITDLGKALIILQYQAGQSDSPTVEHEIITAVDHVKRAIEWEKDRP